MSDKIIQLNEEVVKSELKELVRNSVEETLNELLEKEAGELTNAAKYERTESRQGYHSGHYSRKLTTTSGEVRLNIPKLKDVSFEMAIIECYRRRKLRGGGTDRNVSGGRFGPPCGGYIGGFVGEPGVGIYHQRSESKGLCPH